MRVCRHLQPMSDPVVWLKSVKRVVPSISLIPVPVMSSSNPVSLADRFAAVVEQKQEEEFQKISFAQLSDLRISFGETKLNQRYIDVVKEDPKYVKWFAKKYAQSEKSSHRSFLYFLNLYVERMELTQGNLAPDDHPESPARLNLRAKAKCAPRPSAPPSEVGSWSDEDLGRSWSVQAEVNQQGERLNSMEGTLAQIAQQLQALSQMVMAQNQPRP